MPCNTIKDDEGRVTAIICSRNRRQWCHVCRAACTKLCDFPLTGKKAGQTCDRPMCDRHAVSQGPEVDYCETHDRLAKGV